MTVQASQTNIPKLRFPEFTGEWVNSELGKISDVRDGTHDSPKYQKDGYPLITSKNLLQNGELDLENVSFISEADFTNINKRSKVDIGDILFGMIGTIGNPVLVKSNNYAIKNVALIKKKSKLSMRYLIHYLSGTSIAKQFFQQNAGGTQKFLSLGIIRSLEISYPQKEEQQKIASFLRAVDDKIAGLQKKKDLLESYKKGMMQRLFSQSLRFTDLNGKSFPDWEEKKLGDIGQFTSGTGFSESEQGGKSGVPFLKVSDMNLTGNETTITTANHYVSEKQIQRLKYKPIVQKSIIFAKVGAAVFLERKRLADNFLIDNNMMAFIPSKNILIDFIKIVFDMTRLSKYAQTGALPSYNAGDLKTIKIKIPHPDEQKKIAAFLSAIDDKIALVSDELTHAKTFKKGLLQQMFV